MTPLAHAVDSALMHFLWQGVVVAALLWIALAALRNRSASARYLASCAALGLLALLPMVTAWMSYERPILSDSEPIRLVAAVVLATPGVGMDWLSTLQSWMLPVWACGVLMLSIRMLWGCARVSNLKRKGQRAEPSVIEMVEQLTRRVRVTRPVRVLISNLADGPSVVGWIRPVLLLPAATVLGLSAEQLEAVLAHELAHIRRYDYLVNMIQMGIETVLFYHPAVWWISRRIRAERELCCDDIAVSTCGDPVCYARALAALERMRVMVPSFALGAKDGPLMYRIERLLGTAPTQSTPSRLAGVIAICLALAAAAMNISPARAEGHPSPLTPPLPLAPAPQPPPLQTPVHQEPLHRAIAQSRPDPAPRLLAQANQPDSVTIAVPKSVPSPVELVVEATVNLNGEVDDARVVSGPVELRRFALQRVLMMQFPQDQGPGIRYVTVYANESSVSLPGPILPVQIQHAMTATEAQKALVTALAANEKLKAQQAEASERGAAQLQDYINNNNITIASAARIMAGQDPLVGTTVEAIRIDGFGVTDAMREQILAQLPFHLHDVLSDSSMTGAVRVANTLGTNVTAYFGIMGPGKSGFIINLNGSARVR